MCCRIKEKKQQQRLSHSLFCNTLPGVWELLKEEGREEGREGDIDPERRLPFPPSGFGQFKDQIKWDSYLGRQCSPEGTPE